MTIRRGASGDTVSQIQSRLRDLHFYLGPIDSNFGGGTESALKSFQKSENLPVDGCVGPVTWARLFPNQLEPASDLLGEPVAYRCLALTGSFETSTAPPECFSGVSGDFDGQGISYGALQWNLGQGTLQALLARMLRDHRPACEDIFHDNLPVLEAVLAESREEQLAFARSVQTRRHAVLEPWCGMLKALGRTPECRQLQAELAASLYQRAIGLAAAFDVHSERAIALMFDILVQNGSIGNAVKAQILRDYKQAPDAPGPEREVARMKIIALRRSAAANPQFAEDVRTRKLTIAEGTGTVHGLPYDLEGQFGLRLTPVVPEMGLASFGPLA